MTIFLALHVHFNILKVFVIIACIPITWCYDVELEGKMHLSDAFVNSIKNGNTKPKEFAESLIREVEDMIMRSPNLEGMNIKIPYDLTNVFRRALVSSKGHVAEKTSSQGEAISKFIVHLKEKAAKRLKVISKALKNHFHIQVIAPVKLKKIVSDYSSRMKSYLKIILNEKFVTHNEKDFLLMDIVETSNKILYSEARKLLNEFIDRNQDKIVHEDIRAATQTLYRKNVESKKEDYKFMCLALGLCRSYPAFTDYLAELVSEVLKASNHKFHNFLLLTLKLLKEKLEFFEVTLGAPAVKDIKKRIENQISIDWKSTRESFSVLRAIITRRHEWLYDRSESVSIKTTAIRLFLDIIDKAFEDVGEVTLASQFDMTANALRDWIAGLRNDFESILLAFFSFAAGILEKHLTPEAIMELQALTEIISAYATVNTDLQYELLSKGSRYVGRTNE